MIQVRRVYDQPTLADGLRVLVDRFWPRGLRQEEARIHLWLRDIAPSDGLRRWFGHDPEKWEEFKRRYFEELDNLAEPVGRLRRFGESETVTLLFAAKDLRLNNAVAFAEYLQSRYPGPAP